jgi:hypothetical protein
VEDAAMRSVKRSSIRTARSAVRGLGRVTRVDVERGLSRDAARDARIVAKPLAQRRTVYRYTTRDQALREVRRGLKPGTHTTSTGSRGRPLSASSAQARYGLPRTPEVRETVKLPAGQRVRIGKATGGARGVGEITSPDKVEPNAIKRVVPIK